MTELHSVPPRTRRKLERERSWVPHLPVIHTLYPIGPGWVVYALFEHELPGDRPFSFEDLHEGPPVVGMYPVAAWADVTREYSERGPDGQEVSRGFTRSREPMITINSCWEPTEGITFADSLCCNTGYSIHVIVGPGQEPPGWVNNVPARLEFLKAQAAYWDHVDNQ